MFWGISLCSGKKYSQVSGSPLIMTMAALEPKGAVELKESSDKQICLMIEKYGNEYLICTLEYGRVMQAILDLHIDQGEEYVIFITGDGTVHLSGYTVEEKPNNGGVVTFSSYEEKEISCGILEDNDQNQENEEEEEEVDYLGTNRLLILDDSAEEDNESDDWEPTVTEIEESVGPSYMYDSRPQTRSKKKRRVCFEEDNHYEDSSYVLPQVDIDDSSAEENIHEDAEEVDDENEEEEEANNESEEETNGESEEANEENEVDMEEVESLLKDSTKKRKKSALTNSQSKRAKNDEIHSVNLKFLEPSSKKSKKMKKDRSILENNVNDFRGDDLNSSIGRTPMPKKKAKSFMKLEFDVQEPSSSGKGSTKKALKFGNKLANGIEYEDLRIGIGPMARSGKIVHVHYIGQFTTGKVFEKCTPNDKAFAFRLGRGEVIKGWDVAIEGMKVGGKRKMKIPPSMAYGKKIVDDIPPNSTLIFTVELKAVS